MNPNPEPRPAGSLPGSYFDDVYRAADDPWSFETSAYEAAKYDSTLSALGERRFAQAFEIGCSIGVLTAQLAPRCAQLLAVDVSDAPLGRARRRCATLPQVTLQRMDVPAQFPTGRFDLVLMSEVGYYWSGPDLARAAERIAGSLLPGGLWLLVHWTPVVADYPQTGDQVHDFVLRFAAGGDLLRPVLSRRETNYRLDLLQRTDAAPADPTTGPPPRSAGA